MHSHPRECYKALFEAAKETLFALAADPKYIGSAIDRHGFMQSASTNVMR